MSLVKIVGVDNYNKDILKEGLNEVLEWVNIEHIKDKKICATFDFPQPEFNLIESIKEYLIGNGAESVEFGSAIFFKEDAYKIKNEFEKRGLIFHNFREEPYEEFEVDLKTKKTQHFLGYQILSPGQYQAEKAFENSDFFKVRTLKKVFIPVTLSSSDYTVFITKLKDSPVSKIGGFINSLLYIVPTNIRSEIFLKGLSFKFEDALLDVYGVIKNSVLFGVVDGIQANLTNGIEDEFKILMSSEDLLALDSVMSVLIGFRSQDIGTNKLGSIYKLGCGLLKEVTLDGVDFTKVRRDLLNKLKFKNAFSKRFVPVIEKADNTIDEVANFCPTGAIVKDTKGYYVVDKTKCIKCNFCIEIAPHIFRV